jgi:hypothetical protein
MNRRYHVIEVVYASLMNARGRLLGANWRSNATRRARCHGRSRKASLHSLSVPILYLLTMNLDSLGFLGPVIEVFGAYVP